MQPHDAAHDARHDAGHDAGHDASGSASPEADAHADVRAWVDAHADDLVQRLLDYVAMPGVSAEDRGVREVAEHARGLLERAGLDARIVETGGQPAVVGHRAGPDGAPHLLVYGHHDVQPAGDPAEWTSPPFEPEVRDGRVWGRGAGDNKGQHLAHVAALEALLQLDGELPCSVTVLLDGEEEVGSPHLPALVDALRAELAADVAVVSDGPVNADGRQTVLFGVRGVLQVELRARGAARDVHSGHFSEVPVNPLWTLVHLLASMKGADGRIAVDGVLDAVEPLPPAERAALDALGLDEAAVLAEIGADRLAPSPAGGVAERLQAAPSMTLNGLHGGYGGPGGKTVLPCEAVAKLDLRLVPRQDPHEVLAALRAHVARVAPDVEVVQLGGVMHPSRTPMDSPWAPVVTTAVRRATGTEPLLVPMMGGSLPTHALTDVLGVPTFLVPLAGADERNHAPDENMEVARYLGGVVIAAALVREVAAVRAHDTSATSG